jgi:hypothetical protein
VTGCCGYGSLSALSRTFRNIVYLKTAYEFVTDNHPITLRSSTLAVGRALLR